MPAGRLTQVHMCTTTRMCHDVTRAAAGILLKSIVPTTGERVASVAVDAAPSPRWWLRCSRRRHLGGHAYRQHRLRRAGSRDGERQHPLFDQQREEGAYAGTHCGPYAEVNFVTIACVVTCSCPDDMFCLWRLRLLTSSSRSSNGAVCNR